ncbi:hypothetical protein, partial [Caenicola nitritireducens]|uniref:hypothetical protein n=1 Tax=Caenicola nitritireducens TaxID=2006111 RepID=UPI003ADBE915|nr:hypothetical protein [Synergistaceae bacterium DZ-S4]
LRWLFIFVFASMALGPAPPALISVRQWLSVLRSGGSKKTRFALYSFIVPPLLRENDRKVV